jgi:uncharacterized protein with FMN-binding domain
MKKRTRSDLFQDAGEAAKKLVVSVLIIGAFLVYSLLHNRSSASALSSTIPTDSNSIASASSTGSLYKDGSYTGAVTDALWGYVQVQVVIQNGKMANVQFLQYPHDRNRSVEINGYADPQLIQEAIQAQSAQVDIVTGATDSSEAFIQSLSDALSQAQA